MAALVSSISGDASGQSLEGGAGVRDSNTWAVAFEGRDEVKTEMSYFPRATGSKVPGLDSKACWRRGVSRSAR